MPGCWTERGGRRLRVQDGKESYGAPPPGRGYPGPRRRTRRPPWRSFLLCALLTACSTIVSTPVGLFHDLEGGEIAANRPAPPNATMPYPKLGTVPAKPVLPGRAYRQALQAQLAAERDRTEQVAADMPIEPIPPPPGPAQGAPAGAAPAANATLDTAEAPPPAPAPVAAVPQTVPRPRSAASPPPATPPSVTLPVAEPPVPTDPANLPTMPPAPPAPASFEGVPAEPAPTVRLIPVRALAPSGTEIFFPPASAALPPSQVQALKSFSGQRRGRTVEIIGMGEAASDTPDGQATAVALALGRARAVADALAALRVPLGAMRIGADAFGRGAVLRLLP